MPAEDFSALPIVDTHKRRPFALCSADLNHVGPAFPIAFNHSELMKRRSQSGQQWRKPTEQVALARQQVQA